MAVFTRNRVNGWIKRLKKPFRLWNYIGLRISYIFKWKKIPFYPLYIDIEPNNNCNFKCHHCQVTHWSKESTHLTKDLFSQILDQFPYLEEVKLQGMGEPLLNKQLISMLSLGEERGLFMRFTSNASLCNQKVAEQLSQLQNTSITFSLDGSTAETFESIRVGGRFEQIQKNIRNLSQIRGSKKQPVLLAWTVVTNRNIHEVQQIVKMASDLGIDRITLQPFLSDWGKTEMQAYNN